MNKIFFKFIFISHLLTILCGCSSEDEITYIKTRSDLILAINQANDGDIIYIDDIDLTISGDIHKNIEVINIEKNLTIQSSKNKIATLKGVSFNISGTNVASKKNTITFSNINFDGQISSSTISQESWDNLDTYDNEPKFCKYAIELNGNVDVYFSNCSFKNYATYYGGAIRAFYGDYASIDNLNKAYGQNINCNLSINIDNCTFTNNSSYYSGGAINLEGSKKNISINVNNSQFKENYSSCMDYCLGGGACYFLDCESSLKSCSFLENNGSHSFGKTIIDTLDLSSVPPEFIEDCKSSLSDQTSGGAIRIDNGSLSVIDTFFENNTASLGGGIASYGGELEVDGCSFYQNHAMCDLLNEPSKNTGPWSNMGLGGGLYINSKDGIKNIIYNTSFCKNTARNGYASFYSYYNGGIEEDIIYYPQVVFNFCSFKDNSEIIKYDASIEPLWAARPGNVFEISYIKFNCIAVSDELCTSFFNKYELPTKDNNYCYFTDEQHCLTDKTTFEFDGKQVYLKSNGTLSTKVPKDFINEIISNKYGSKSKSFTIGTNYSTDLYVTKKSNATLIIAICASIIVLASALSLILVKFFKKVKKVTILNTQNNENELERTESIVAKIANKIHLSPREEEVLKLVLKGMKRNEIAKTLFLSDSAIKKYTSQIYKKLNVHSKIELIVRYGNDIK